MTDSWNSSDIKSEHASSCRNCPPVIRTVRNVLLLPSEQDEMSILPVVWCNPPLPPEIWTADLDRRNFRSLKSLYFNWIVLGLLLNEPVCAKIRKTLAEKMWFDVIRRLCLSVRLHCLIADNVITFSSEGGLMIDCLWWNVLCAREINLPPERSEFGQGCQINNASLFCSLHL